jgi:hypothetical protein
LFSKNEEGRMKAANRTALAFFFVVAISQIPPPNQAANLPNNCNYSKQNE